MKTIEMIDTLTSALFHQTFFTIFVTYEKENYLNVRGKGEIQIKQRVSVLLT